MTSPHGPSQAPQTGPRSPRARDLLNRSRKLLDRSRVAAAQLLDPPHRATPLVLDASPRERLDTGDEGAMVGVCATIALRDLNLVDSLLAQLEGMEESETDPDRLAELYRLDHLATRLRRNAENLRVLAGRDAGDALSDTTPVVDVIRAAMSHIDAYARVSIGRVVSLGVVGISADDLGRVLAELLDNATQHSPPDTSVRVSAHLTEEGSVLLRIEDEGIGLPEQRLAELNARLTDDPVLDDDSVRHMGLAVARRLTARHGMRARLDRRSPHGTTATVLLPAGLVCELPENAWSGARTVSAQPQVHASTPHPRPASSPPAGTTEGGLPRRTTSTTTTAAPTATKPPAPPSPPTPPTPPAAPAVATARTTNGLPRRISQSIKSPADGQGPTPEPTEPMPPPADATPEDTPATPPPELSEKAGHDQLLADLDAFSDGEQAALREQQRHDVDSAGPEPPGGPHDGLSGRPPEGPPAEGPQ